MDRTISTVWRWLKNTVSFYTLLLAPHRDSVRAFTTGKPVVVLLCGWGGTRHTMSVLERRLARDGMAPYAFPLGGALGRFNTKGIDDLAFGLMRHLSSMAMSHPEMRVAIVGHSMGGLIGRAVVTICGGASRVHTLVTLGTPHRGSPLADTARRTPLSRYSKALGQMVSGSAFLRKLQSAPIPGEVYCASIFSRSDHYCPPPAAEIEIPPGRDNVVNVDAGRIGHVEFVVNEETYELILRELRTGLARTGLA